MISGNNTSYTSLNESKLLSNNKDTNKSVQEINLSIRSDSEFQPPYDKCTFFIPFSKQSLNNSRQKMEPELLNENDENIKPSNLYLETEDSKEALIKPTNLHGYDSNELNSENTDNNMNENLLGSSKFDLGSLSEGLDREELLRYISTSTVNRSTTPRHGKANVPHHVRKSFCQAKGTNLDHVLGLTGSFGFYQKYNFLLVGFLAVLPAMVAYSYVFVSATPKFTCSIVKEVQLISTNGSNIKILKEIDQLDPDEIDEDDPFKNLNWEYHEYVIETRRFIRLIPEDMPNKEVKFDNNCNFDSKKVLDVLSKFNPKAQQIQELNKIVPSLKSDESTSTRSGPLKNPSNQQISKKQLLKSNFKCVEWIYDESLYGQTTATDWDLVCLKSHLKAATQNTFILGTGCSLFTGILSDRFGRRTALLLMIVLMILVLNVTQFFMHTPVLDNEEKFIIFTISRFFQGVGTTMYSIGFVLLLEMTGPKHRVTAGNIMAYSFSIGQMLTVGLAYFFKNWLKFHWALAIYVLPFITYYWLMPESPRWLLSIEDVAEARYVISKITRQNAAWERFVQRFCSIFCRCFYRKNRQNLTQKTQIDVDDDDTWDYIVSLLRAESNSLAQAKKNTSYMQTLRGIIKSPILLRRCFILFFTWMVILGVYLGIGMGIAGNLDKFLNPYLTFLIAASCEFLGIVTCQIVLNRFGRKYPLVIFLLITSIAIYLIPVYFHTQPRVSMVSYFLAKYSIGAAQLTCMIYTSELYPTPMRSTGVGLSVALARLGGVWAPQINVLSSTLGSIYVPFIIFSAFTFLAGILCTLLPETLNKQLPENIAQAKAMK